MEKKTVDVIFIRRDGADALLMAKAKLTTAEGVKVGSCPVTWGMSRLQAAVTEWVRNTQDGKEVWDMSCQDLNIGDLLCAGAGTMHSLGRFLKAQGIVKMSLESEDLSKTISFDSLLARESDIENSEVAIH